MDYRMPGFPVFHCLLEFAQIHIHWVGDAIQPFHPRSFTSPPALNLSQESGSFPVSQLFTSGGQSIGASASASVLSMNIQGWFPLELADLIFLQSKGLSRAFSSTAVQKHQFLDTQPSFLVQLSQRYMTTGIAIALTIRTFVGKVMSLLFNKLSRFLIAFLLRSRCLLISWLWW